MRTRATNQGYRPGGAGPRHANAIPATLANAANDNIIRHPRDYDLPRRETYADRTSLLNFIDRHRFARAVAARDPGSKPSRAERIAAETGFHLYDACVSVLKDTDRDLYRLYLRFGLSCVYNDIKRISRRRLVPYIAQLLAERRIHATVPGEILETLADTIREGLRREYCVDLDRVA